ncbi:TnsA endonuclease [Saccharothrix sp. NRRL B-16348]|nr:TnsA endonuclease [Saccharothrix sp. NRRL B-16348]
MPTFRWYRGQKHHSGTYWSSTMKGHVPYESRLELARLLFADFDSSVRVIAAQPFLLEKEVLGVRRRSVPDFLLLTGSGPVVVDVKPQALLSRPEVARALAWTRDEVEPRGWRYEVWSEPPLVELECVRFLAAYRREWLFDGDLLVRLRSENLDGARLLGVCRTWTAWPVEVVRAAVLHLMWCGHFVVDLAHPTGPGHILRIAR